MSHKLTDHEITRKTIEAYDKYAEIYDQEVVDFWDNFPTQTIPEFTKRLSNPKILNLGSGSGQDALLLRQAGCDVDCVDGSEAMTYITQSLGFQSQTCFFEDLIIQPNRYAGVWAYTSLLHLATDKMIEIIEKVHHALPNSGVFMIGMIEGDQEGLVERETMPRVERYFKFYSPEDLQRIVTNIGFSMTFQDSYTPSSKTYFHQIYTKTSQN